MKYKKLLLFIPLLALAACDGQTPEGGEDLSSNSDVASSGEVSNPDTSSDVNSSTSLIPADPSHREEILTAIKNINSFTAEVEQVFNAHFNVSESLPQPDFDANISTKDVMKNVGKRMSVNSSGTSLITYKTSEYAAKAHISEEEAYQALKDMFKFSDDKTTFTNATSDYIEKYYLDYDEDAKQYYFYSRSYDENDVLQRDNKSYLLEEEIPGEKLISDSYYSLVKKVVKDGAFDEASHSFTINTLDDEIKGIVEEMFSKYNIVSIDFTKIFTSFKVNVENNQLKSMNLECGTEYAKLYSYMVGNGVSLDEDAPYEASYKLTFKDLNSTTITDFPTEKVACDNHAGSIYDCLEDGHRAYCQVCGLYLEEKEEHAYLEGDHHICGVCGAPKGSRERTTAEKFLLQKDYAGGFDAYLFSYKQGEDGFRYDPAICYLDGSAGFIGGPDYYEYNGYYYLPEFKIGLKCVSTEDYLASDNCHLLETITYTIFRDVEMTRSDEDYNYYHGSTPMSEYLDSLSSTETEVFYDVSFRHGTSGADTEKRIEGCIYETPFVCERCGEVSYSNYHTKHTFDSYTVLDEDDMKDIGELKNYSFDKPEDYLFCQAHCSACDKNITVIIHLEPYKNHLTQEYTVVVLDKYHEETLNDDYHLTLPHIPNEAECAICAYVYEHMTHTESVAITYQLSDCEEMNAFLGTNFTIDAEVYPHESDEPVVWTSSDKNVATVDENGNVNLVATGTTTITATSGSATDTCLVTVRAAGYYVSYDNNLIYLAPDGKDGDEHNLYHAVISVSSGTGLIFSYSDQVLSSINAENDCNLNSGFGVSCGGDNLDLYLTELDEGNYSARLSFPTYALVVNGEPTNAVNSIPNTWTDKAVFEYYLEAGDSVMIAYGNDELNVRMYENPIAEDGYYRICWNYYNELVIENISSEYFLAGSFNGSTWTTDPTFAPFIENSVDDEYKLANTITLHAGDELKVKNATTYYPDLVDNYVVPQDGAGIYQIYFRPNGSGGEGWYYNVFYLEKISDLA